MSYFDKERFASEDAMLVGRLPVHGNSWEALTNAVSLLLYFAVYFPFLKMLGVELEILAKWWLHSKQTGISGKVPDSCSLGRKR